MEAAGWTRAKIGAAEQPRVLPDAARGIVTLLPNFDEALGDLDADARVLAAV